MLVQPNVILVPDREMIARHLLSEFDRGFLALREKRAVLRAGQCAHHLFGQAVFDRIRITGQQAVLALIDLRDTEAHLLDQLAAQQSLELQRCVKTAQQAKQIGPVRQRSPARGIACDGFELKTVRRDIGLELVCLQKTDACHGVSLLDQSGVRSSCTCCLNSSLSSLQTETSTFIGKSDSSKASRTDSSWLA